MFKRKDILVDSFGRKHNYLRISLTERCSFRCTYCMPERGVQLSPKSNLMNAGELYQIAKVFVDNGVDKIRLTGGEPLVRKDFTEILKKLSTLKVKLSITTNAFTADRFIDDFKAYGLNDINASLDTLQNDKFWRITRRDQFPKVYANILLLIKEGFNLKLNVVLIKGFNDDEIVDFIMMTKDLPITVRFIEFMPFDGNEWSKEKLVSQKEILEKAIDYFGEKRLFTLKNENNFTAQNYKIEGFKGEFGIISTVTNPFCDGCNRLRLTANGKIKNCLFSNNETDLLSILRRNESLEAHILEAVYKKKAIRAGMDNFKKLNNPKLHNNNRSMITIGG
ncbi:MAG: GTP 3',8-cyclase MoaA [Bacteroidales bacterium]|nr:MAG: GTP 3',8-cyclase MoaA [Bacteroidales bacterium]